MAIPLAPSSNVSLAFQLPPLVGLRTSLVPACKSSRTVASLFAIPTLTEMLSESTTVTARAVL